MSSPFEACRVATAKQNVNKRIPYTLAVNGGGIPHRTAVYDSGKWGSGERVLCGSNDRQQR